MIQNPDDNRIFRKVKVNRDRSPKDALDATNRVQQTNPDVVAAMPRGEGEDVLLEFFKPEHWEYTQRGFINEEDLEKAFTRRSLKPADPISVAALNEAEPTFANKNPHGTHWKDDKGKWCAAVFCVWDEEGGVVVDQRHTGGWPDNIWFTGIRK